MGKDENVYLFGSRTDDAKKGADIDLYIEIASLDVVFDKKLSLLTELRKKLGDQKVMWLSIILPKKKIFIRLLK